MLHYDNIDCDNLCYKDYIIFCFYIISLVLIFIIESIYL
jgi:hypothetical protein